MSLDLSDTLEKLSIEIKSNNVETVRDILSNIAVFKNDNNYNCVICTTFSGAFRCQNPAVFDVLMDFLDSIEIKSHLVHYLRNALEYGKVRIAEMLFSKGATLEDPEWQGISPTDHAFVRRNVGMRKDLLLLLIQHGLDTKFINPVSGRSILSQFIYSFVREEDDDAVDVAEVLVNSGLSVNQLDNTGFSPLHFAVLRGNDQLVSFLIQQGAAVSHKSKTLLDAADMMKSEIFPLYYAALHSEDDTIDDLLLSHGADINESNNFGLTALHNACYHHKFFKISFLFEKGANFGAEDVQGRTPFSLLQPEKKDYEECVEVMMKEFAKLNFKKLLNNEISIDFIETKPKAQEYLNNFMVELKLMSDTQFYPPYSVFYVLKLQNNIKKLALLTKNKNFVKKLSENLSCFHHYEDELEYILEEALRVRDDLAKIESSLYSIFGNVFTPVVIKNFANYLTVQDLQSH